MHRRGDAYTFRIAVPIELRPYILCRELTKSLRTTDKKIAFPRALELAASCKRLFYDLREIMSDSSSDSKLDLPTRMRIEAERIKLRWAKEEHEAEIKKLEETRRQEIKLHNAKIEAYKEILSGIQPSHFTFQSDHIDTGIKKEVPTTPSKLHKLSEVIPLWISKRNPAKSSISAFTFAISRFEKLYPNLYAETITSEHINEFVEKLESENLSAKTISKDHSMIRALFTIAVNKKWVDSNPAVGTLLPSKKTSRPPVRGYTIEELNSIFSSPVFTSGERPASCKGEAALWVPLLLLFTGARREEICQLATQRVRLENSINVIDLDTLDEEDGLKTATSFRTVPVHDFLIKLGFLEYVKTMMDTGSPNQMLFPLLRKNERGQNSAQSSEKWKQLDAD